MVFRSAFNSSHRPRGSRCCSGSLPRSKRRVRGRTDAPRSLDSRLPRRRRVFLVNPSFQLARIAGIRIGVHWSWLIVFALIVWSLASAVFPSQNPGFSDGEYVAMAVVAALLFFASLLLHELGHALQARRDEVEIEGINLWLFGGVAQFK